MRSENTFALHGAIQLLAALPGGRLEEAVTTGGLLWREGPGFLRAACLIYVSSSRYFSEDLFRISLGVRKHILPNSKAL